MIVRCHGPHNHVAACRKARPLCRWRRPKACHCGAYHFPHRDGSGRCGDDERMNAYVYGPIPTAEAS